MAIVFYPHRLGDLSLCRFPSLALRILQRNPNYGIFTLFLSALRIPPYLCALEKMRVALLRFLEEGVQHLKRERLAKSARSREEGDRGLAVEQTRYELRLVGAPISGLDLSPITVANRERQQFLGSGKTFGNAFHRCLLYHILDPLLQEFCLQMI